MSHRKAVVEAYVDGFRRSDHAAILGCLGDDIEWVLHGYKTVRGKAEFDAEIENDAQDGPPEIEIRQLVEEGDTVVAVGGGVMKLKDQEPVRFVFTEVFTFTGDLVSRLETLHLNLIEHSIF